MDFQRRHIVQDRETARFLGFEDGDIAPVSYIRNAVKFDSEEAAVLTALEHCSAGYLVFTFYLPVE